MYKFLTLAIDLQIFVALFVLGVIALLDDEVIGVVVAHYSACVFRLF